MWNMTVHGSLHLARKAEQVPQRLRVVADPYNSPPPEISRRSTKLAALNQLLGTFARKLASLKQ